MKDKKILLYLTLPIITLFIGIIGTLFAIKYIDKPGGIIKTVKDVTITESDSISTSVEKVYDAVVFIENYKNNQLSSVGTGFFYKQENKTAYVITNNHVVSGATKVVIYTMDGKELEAKVLGTDEYSDVAALSVQVDDEVTLATLGKSEDSKIGDTLFTVGSPMGKSYIGTVTKGILSGKNRTVTVSGTNGSYLMEVLQTDAAINPGNSGGPLVNMNGEVIGVNSMKLVQDEIEGMGFAIPIEYVIGIVDKLEKGETIDRPVFGVEMIDVTSTWALLRAGINIDNNITEGIVVYATVDNSPAAKMGLQKGDIITKIDNVKVESSAYFRYQLYKHSIGDNIKITYIRNGKEYTKEVKLTK